MPLGPQMKPNHINTHFPRIETHMLKNHFKFNFVDDISISNKQTMFTTFQVLNKTSLRKGRAHRDAQSAAAGSCRT